MKNHRLLILSLIIFNIFIVNAQDVFIYDKSGNKIYLYEQKNMYIIRIDEQYLRQTYSQGKAYRTYLPTRARALRMGW